MVVSSPKYKNTNPTASQISDMDDWLHANFSAYGDPTKNNYLGYGTNTIELAALAAGFPQFGFTQSAAFSGWTMAQLQQELANGYPVIVYVYAQMDIGSADGHYMVLLGMDSQNVYMNDPGLQFGGQRSRTDNTPGRAYPLGLFESAWAGHNNAGVTIHPNAPPPPPQYSITDVGNLPGSNGPTGWPYSMKLNNAGQLAGTAFLPGPPYNAGFVWSASTGYINFYQSHGATYITGINNAGHMPGTISFSPSSPFLYADGALTLLPPAPNGWILSPLGINNHDQIVGYLPPAFGSVSQGNVATVYSGGVFTNLNVTAWSNCGAVTICNAYGIVINDNGQVAGIYRNGQVTRGWFYDSGGLVDLGTPSGAVVSVTGINNSAQVVGGFGRAFIWSRAGGPIDLGALPGTNPNTIAYGVNNNGQVVGSSVRQVAGNFVGSAFIWTNTLGMIDLNTLVNDPTWVLTSADAINNNGQIAGIGTHNGQSTIFLLTPIISQFY
jgi:probable HAF family extracellular repeat protein